MHRRRDRSSSSAWTHSQLAMAYLASDGPKFGKGKKTVNG